MSNVYKENYLKFADKGLIPLAIKSGAKRPAASEWQKLHDKEKWIVQHQKWMNSSALYGVGVLLGPSVRPGQVLAALDIDRSEYIALVNAFLGGGVRVRKKGMKGTTFIVLADEKLETKRFKVKGLNGNTVEFLSKGACTVLPPSIHPETKQPYQWETESLDAVDLNSLPVVDIETFQKIRFIAENQYLPTLFSGDTTHDDLLKFIGAAVQHLSDEEITTVVRLALPAGYAGNSLKEMPGMIESAREKGFDTPKQGKYEPDDEGPIPLGYTRDGSYALLDQHRNIIVLASSGQLMTGHYLVGLASSDFWWQQFPGQKSKINAHGAGETLMQQCRVKGSFSPHKVRGRGVWLDKGNVIINFDGRVQNSAQHIYLCFDPLPFAPDEQPNFDAGQVLKFLQLFNWIHEEDAYLLFGWMAVAPICGALSWRPHCFLHGPKNTGKTTLVKTLTQVLHPLRIAIEGGSTEAGIRQALGCDSLPVIIDEFESDQERRRLASIIKLARSASSADSQILKGTPEGKAMQFSIRATFLFAAINPLTLSAADESRIVQLELKAHDNDLTVRQKIVSGAKSLENTGNTWCSMAISHAVKLPPTVEKLGLHFPACDSRHRINMATLLAGAYLALNGAIPDDRQAKEWVDRFEGAIMRHEEAHMHDDAEECLARLFSFLVGEQQPIGGLLADALDAKLEQHNCSEAADTLRKYGIRVEVEGFYIANCPTELDKTFSGTRWDGGWRKALRKIEGVKPVDPIQFTHLGKHRAVFVPAEKVPEKEDPMELKGRI